VTRLLHQDGRVIGVEAVSSAGKTSFHGQVILATGAHDWSADLTEKFTGIPPGSGGSVAPGTLSGDAIRLTEPLHVSTDALPAWAAPVLPGYQIAEAAFDGDTRFRACYEHCLPHTFLVNKAGLRFCDDSFHTRIVSAVLQDVEANLPFYMIWDSQHHQKYGLGATMPGNDYPVDLVKSAPTLEELASLLDLPPRTLVQTADRFNESAATGTDPDFGRGTNLSVRMFRGDTKNTLNPNVGPVDQAPFFGMRMRLLNTGIAASGIRTGPAGRVINADNHPIAGLYAVGECSARSAAGVGYNSGYSLSRAMAFGFLAANSVAESIMETTGNQNMV
jgi:3-oxosteroid 1-dehydrogenase